MNRTKKILLALAALALLVLVFMVGVEYATQTENVAPPPIATAGPPAVAPVAPLPAAPAAIPTTMSFVPEAPSDRHFVRPEVIPAQGEKPSVRLTSEAAPFIERYPVLYAAARPGQTLTAEEEAVRKGIVALAKEAGFEDVANKRQGITLDQYKLDAVANTAKDKLVYILRSPNIAHLWDTKDPEAVKLAEQRVRSRPAGASVKGATTATPTSSPQTNSGELRCPGCGAKASGIRPGTSVKCKHPGCGGTING
jgi:hypothetical protein